MKLVNNPNDNNYENVIYQEMKNVNYDNEIKNIKEEIFNNLGITLSYVGLITLINIPLYNTYYEPNISKLVITSVVGLELFGLNYLVHNIMINTDKLCNLNKQKTYIKYHDELELYRQNKSFKGLNHHELNLINNIKPSNVTEFSLSEIKYLKTKVKQLKI